MAIDFPASPTLNQTFSSGNVNYVWDGTKWTASVTGGISLDKIEKGNTKAEVVDTGTDGRFVVTTEGTERLRVDSSGRVGIGTSSPDSSLTITKDAAVGINIRSADANFSSLLFGCDTVSGFNFITSSTSGSGTLRPISFRMGASEAFRVDTSGRVGIGTTSAGGILHTLTTGSDNVNFFERASGAKFGIYNSSVNSYIGTFSNHDLRLATNDTERARIDTSGRLLVGTSSNINGALVQIAQENNLTSTTVTLNPAGGLTLFAPTNTGNYGPGIWFNHGGLNAGIASCRLTTGNWGTELRFYTHPDTTTNVNDVTERMRISSSGGVLINTTTHRDSARLVVDGDGSSVNSVWYAPSTSSYSVLYFRNPNGNTGRIDLSGTTTSYVTTSDYRLKENIEPVTNGIARLQQLKPSRFNFIVDPDKTVDGFIAHEVQDVVPEAISGEKDAVDADGNPVYQGIDQSKLVPLLTAALQEAIGEIESLKARVAALESA